MMCYACRTCDEGKPKKCPYMTGVPSSQVPFNVKVHLATDHMQFTCVFRLISLITGFTVLILLSRLSVVFGLLN